VEELRHLPEVFLLQAPGGKGRGAEPQAAGPQGTLIPWRNQTKPLIGWTDTSLTVVL